MNDLPTLLSNQLSEPTELLIALALCFLLGALLAWLLLLPRRNAQREQLANTTRHAEELEQELQAGRVSISEYQIQIARLETELANERKQAEEKLKLLDEAQQKLGDAFKALSADALETNNQRFLRLAKGELEKFQQGAQHDLEKRQKAVDDLVKPIKDSLEKVDTKIGEMEKTRLESYSELNTQLKGLVETHLPRLHNETANLVKALRQPTVRGRWGEIQLKRVVEMAGMLEHCDFIEQPSSTTEGGRIRPDLIVHLPGGKQIVVDAKAPVSAYLDATEATDDATRAAFMTDHARQVRKHITDLSRKTYLNDLDVLPEFVVLFLPGEMFFSAALQEDPGLIEFGVKEKVIPATPTTLIALLRAVHYGWRQEALAKDAQVISQLGKELYERLTSLAGHWANVGKGLDRAMDAYNKATGSLESRVLVTARRFNELQSTATTAELETIDPLDHAARTLQAPELTGDTDTPTEEK